MARKQKKSSSPPHYVLPTNNKQLQLFIEKNKASMIEQVIRSVEYAVSNNLSLIEVFEFKSSNFVITLSEKDYLSNLDNVYSFCVKTELYEYCPKIVALQKALKMKIGQLINDEK
jgi:hypothetical protein